MEEFQVDEIIKNNIDKIKTNVFKLLGNQGYLKVERDYLRVPKSIQRRERSPKNLTDIFKLNSKGQIKRMGSSTSSNKDKKQIFRSSRHNLEVNFQSKINTPVRKISKMNISIQRYSKQLKQLNTSVIISPPKTLDILIKRQSWQNKTFQIQPQKERKSFKKLSKRKRFLRTLENQTQRQLSMQKQALSMLSEYEWSINKGEKQIQKNMNQQKISKPRKINRLTARTFRF